MERLTPPSIEFDKKQLIDVRKIGENALKLSAQRYCSGLPSFTGGSIRKLAYHNAYHNRSVGDDAERVANRVGLSASELELAKTAGYTHDLVQLKGRGDDERESAEWLEQQLREKGLPKEVASMAYKAIWGTLPIFRNGQIVNQTANTQEYSSKREELVAKSVASADLGRLYVPEGPYLGHLLYMQIQGVDPEDTPDMENLPAFAQNQSKFLHTYKYPLKEADRILPTHKSQVLKYIDQLAEDLREGRIESWEELLRRDLAFMKNPNKRIV